MPPSPRLSKTRFLAGEQCEKRLWWTVHEPQAPELAPTPEQQARFDEGHRVGAAARERFPGGVLVDLPHGDYEGRIAATKAALEAGAPAIFEASFSADGIFAAVDVLLREPAGFAIVEVKSSLDVKPEHLPDVAVQLHVVRASGLPVTRVELMHLSRACRHPDLSNLFVREDVTAAALAGAPQAAERARRFQAMLGGPLPVVPTGGHCEKPYVCPFRDRCWPELPLDHVSNLFGVEDHEVAEWHARGIELAGQVPATWPLDDLARRRIRSFAANGAVAEPGLADALALLVPPVAHLDFETVSPAIPAWPGCPPYDKVPVQFSLQLEKPDGSLEEHAFLASGGSDPRPALAEALLAACDGVATLVCYGSYERQCIDALVRSVPARAKELSGLRPRLVDLLRIVKGWVYHPRFERSFSLKKVAPALAPELSYDDLAVREGSAAASLLARLLLEPGTFTAAETARARQDLLSYCARDTLATVAVLRRLRELS